MFLNKYHFLFCFACLTLLLSIKANARDSFLCPADTAIVINPIPEQGPEPNGPRSPALIPISAYYDSSLSSVLLSFRSNLGEIEVEVLNSSTGGYSSTFVDTQFLYSVIPITLGSGHYIITFTLSSGQQYQGEFNV